MRIKQKHVLRKKIGSYLKNMSLLNNSDVCSGSSFLPVRTWYFIYSLCIWHCKVKESFCSEVKTFISLTSDGRALAVGGMAADLLPRSVLQQYDLRKDVWALLPPMSTPRYDTSVCLLGSKIYVAGLLTASLCICNLSLWIIEHCTVNNACVFLP